MTLLTFTGYHGTSKENAENILNSNFIPSTNHDDWLGHGVYFFIDGISCPKENSKQWAINQAWDKNKQCNTYTDYSVIKAHIEIAEECVLDLTSMDGLRAFNEMRDYVLHKGLMNFAKNRNLDDDDQRLCNKIIAMTKSDALIANLYIKNILQRKKQIASRIPNSKVLVVINHKICIKQLTQVVTGKIR